MLKLSLLLIFSLFYISTQATSACSSLSTSCSCSNNDTSYTIEFIACAQPTTLAPTTKQAVPSNFLATAGSSTSFGTTTGDTVAVFDDLYYGAYYEFSTCDRKTTVTTNNKFDSVLVLRDPSGHFLGSNDNCHMNAANQLCSYILYQHTSLSFDSVYLSVYYKEDGSFVCNGKSALESNTVTIFADLLWTSSQSVGTTPLTCSLALPCASSFTTNVGTTLTASDFINLSDTSAVCGAPAPLSYTVGGKTVTDTCSDIGTHTVVVSLFGSNCSVPYTVSPTTSIVSCSVSGNFYIYPSDVLFSNCVYGTECVLSPTSYAPLVYVEDACDVFSSTNFPEFGISFTTTPGPIDEVPFGQDVSYVLTVTNSYGVVSSPTTCIADFAGISILSLTSAVDDSLVSDGGDIYFNIAYDISFSGYLYPSGEESVTIIPFLSQLLSDDLIFPTYSTSESCDNEEACTTSVRFCFPSDTTQVTLDEFYYVGAAYDSTNLAQTLVNPGDYTLFDPRGQTQKRSTKRSTPIYFESLGNPLVVITDTDLNTYTCEDFFEERK